MNRHINFSKPIKRYNHNLSYRNFFSGEIGEMRPVWLEDAIPGDTFQYTPELRMFFAPLVFPVLTNMKARVDVFFVPNRLAWSEWENFITGGPDNALDPAYPSVKNIAASISSDAGLTSQFQSWFTAVGNSYNSLLNNLGHPKIPATNVTASIGYDPYDLIPFYDYLFIFDEYYRDEEKEPTSITGYGGIHRDVYDIFQDSTIAGLVANSASSLKSIAWAKDYFTSASLEQQRGGDVPLLTNPMFKFDDSSLSFQAAGQRLSVSGTSTPSGFVPGSLYADGINSGGTVTPGNLNSVLTINGLKYLTATAAWLNNNVVGGTRYIEVLNRRYHVVSSDARLQRPEMVGSISLPVSVDVVTQTSSTVEDSDSVQALGDRAGKAAIVGRGKTLTYSAEEFGYFIAILHVAPKAAYFQGIRRNLQRQNKFDFFMPEFENTPQQEIFNNEIYTSGQSGIDPEISGIFGYQSRYSEYKHHNDEVHGDFQDSLLAWTMARKFASVPSITSPSFLRVDHDATGNNRIFAVPESTYAHIFGVVNNIVSAKRIIKSKEPRF